MRARRWDQLSYAASYDNRRRDLSVIAIGGLVVPAVKQRLRVRLAWLLHGRLRSRTGASCVLLADEGTRRAQ